MLPDMTCATVANCKLGFLRRYDFCATFFANPLNHDNVPVTGDLHDFRSSPRHHPARSLAHGTTGAISRHDLRTKERKLFPAAAGNQRAFDSPLRVLQSCFRRWVHLPMRIGLENTQYP
ncbi:MAG TPA: hypothetical protein PK970_09310 [Hyphomicrobiaceae bacterium]|nr:hypothetical protein [Hyphomicrobiaceae bacterium]